MSAGKIPSSMILAEVLRLQRWAGGDSVAAARIFGLLNRFQSVVDEETEAGVISREDQDKVEEMLVDIENGEQSTDGMSLKSRLRNDDIDESVASKVIELCRLQARLGEATDKLINDPGSPFHHLKAADQPEQQWFGATHYMELYDSTEDATRKLHSVFAATVPRVGEMITPPNGSPMQVVDVNYVMVPQGEDEGIRQHYLVPYVMLEPIDEEEGDESDGD